VEKKRNSKAQTEKKGVIYVRGITNDADHIFREVLEEDVGVDAQIEICANGKPTGMLIGLQIKSGESYIHSETPEVFTYRPRVSDLRYWRDYTLPLFLIIYRPLINEAYWVDIKEHIQGNKLEDMILGLIPKKVLINKRNIFSKNIFNKLEQKLSEEGIDKYWSDVFFESLQLITLDQIEEFGLPPYIFMYLYNFPNIHTSQKLLDYVQSRRDVLTQAWANRMSLPKTRAEAYIDYLADKLLESIFRSEGTGFMMLAFDEKEDRDSVQTCLEDLIPLNRYLIMTVESTVPLPMNYFLIIASDGWDDIETPYKTEFFRTLEQSFSLRWERNYEFVFYNPRRAVIFLSNPDYYSRYTFRIICDTEDNLVLFDYLRLLNMSDHTNTPEKPLYFSIGNERVKIYWSWDDILYWYFSCIKAIRSEEKYKAFYDYFLHVEFDVSNEKDKKEFFDKAKSAKSLKELPFMTEYMLRSIEEGSSYTSYSCDDGTE
jgi:hypothetical protein